MNKIISIIILSLLGIGFHGTITLEILIICVSLGIIVSFLNQNLMVDNDKLKLSVYWVRYISILLYEVVKANLDVAYIIMSPKLEIEPQIVEYKTRLTSPKLKTILANSIILTPGTLTVGIKGNSFSIHCLKSKYVEGLADNNFERILLQIEAKSKGGS